MAESYVFTVSGDVSKYAKELSKLPGITEEEASKAAIKMGAKFAQAQDKVAKGAKKAAEDTGKAFSEAADKLGEKAGKIRGALDLLAPGAGEFAGAIADFADAAVVLGPVAGSIAAIGVAFAAPVAAVALLDGALIKLAFSADESLQKLEGFKAIGSDFYPAIPASTLDSFKNLAASTDALSSIGEHLSVVLGANVAPAVEHVTDIVVGMALVTADMIEKWSVGKNLFEEVARGTLMMFAQALLSPLKPLSMMEDALVALADLVGQPVPEGFRKAHEEMKAFIDGGGAKAFADMAIAAAENSGALDGLGSAFDSVAARGRAFIGTQERATAATKASTAAAKAAADQQKRETAEAFSWMAASVDSLNASKPESIVSRIIIR